MLFCFAFLPIGGSPPTCHLVTAAGLRDDPELGSMGWLYPSPIPAISRRAVSHFFPGM